MKICVSIIEPRLEAAVDAARSAVSKGADMVEVRFDMQYPLPTNLSSFSSVHVPKIATLRTVDQGGKYSGNERERLAFFQTAMRAGFDFIDLEHDSSLLDRREKELRGVILISSYHDFEKTPPASAILDIMIRASSKGAIPKAAFKVNGMADLLSIIDAARMFSTTDKKFVLIGMGELGEVIRMCADEIGSAFSYAALEEGKEAAPGQIDVEKMKALSEKRTIVGIIGHPLSHTMSPAMHNAAFTELKMAGRYLAFPVQSTELETFLQVAVEVDLRGFNVTIPHKEAIVPLLDRLDPSAEKVKAVNTVLMEEGQLIGFNTDVHGVSMVFKEAGVLIKGRKALIIGAGGAARACCAALSESGARIVVVNRTGEKAEALSRDFKNTRAANMQEFDKEAFDIVINCTPLGMKGFPDEMPLPPSIFKPGQFVMDLIYNPQKTRFLTEAEKRGAIIANGESMLIHQALKAFEIWTGRGASFEAMLGALRGGGK